MGSFSIFSITPITRTVEVVQVMAAGRSRAGNEISIFPITPTGSARSQRSRGLDSEERSPKGDPDDRGSGKSERSERNDAGGRCGVVV